MCDIQTRISGWWPVWPKVTDRKQQSKAVTGRQRLKIPGAMCLCHKAATKCHLQVTSWFTGAGNWEILVKTQVLSVNCSTLACNTGSFFPTFKDKQRLTWQKRTLTHNKILHITLKLWLNWPVPVCIKTFHQPVKTRKIRRKWFNII